MSFLNEKNKVMEVDEETQEEIVFNRPMRKKSHVLVDEDEFDTEECLEVEEVKDKVHKKKVIRRSLRQRSETEEELEEVD